MLILSIFFCTTFPVQAQNSVSAYLFYGDGCPHCAKERNFLHQLEKKYAQLKIKEYEIYYNQQNSSFLKEVAHQLNAEAGGVPFLVIGKKYFIGYAEGATSNEIEQAVLECTENACDDFVVSIVDGSGNEKAEIGDISTNSLSVNTSVTEGGKIQVPFFGTVQIDTLSLPVLTFILAFLDGFNPCAMWTLLFLISLLLGMRDRKRMWILGVAFIISSATVYFLFLSAWLNIFLFLGFIVWVRMLIGILALGTGGYYMQDFLKNKQGSCSITGNQKRQQIFQKLQKITEKPQLILALGGIILLAIAVNMVELICSAGLPAIYTQILSLSHLPLWQYYFYLGFYIFIFMLDDLFVFFTAMITLQAVGIQSTYARYSHLIGGICMFIIGVLLLFKPEWLMFG
ncbi:MAG: hypothetical protein A2378_01920 [Candidatus Pacebacteria bacterium RIFOXYB1_FULL_44_10]|nr:MAG: hypothetical protein A2378_01920 [Candidatus Pacebacteria bacterium RIFOXYB1_FULL_44_10]